MGPVVEPGVWPEGQRAVTTPWLQSGHTAEGKRNVFDESIRTQIRKGQRSRYKNTENHRQCDVKGPTAT